MYSKLPLLSLPLLAAGAHHGHKHAHVRADELGRRVLQTEVIVMTQFVTETVTVGGKTTSSAPDLSVPPPASKTTAVASSAESLSFSFAAPAASSSTAKSPQSNSGGSNPYLALETVPYSAIILNSCEYPVYVWSDGHRSCDGTSTECKRIEPNSTYTEKLRSCQDGGISLKLSKTKDASKPMQFEYSVWQSDKTTVSYDISYLNCMNNNNGEKDLSECAGHDGGIQATGEGDCPDYHCLAGKWCDTQAYVVAEYGYLPGAPVGACKVDKGIAFELCAEKR